MNNIWKVLEMQLFKTKLKENSKASWIDYKWEYFFIK